MEVEYKYVCVYDRVEYCYEDFRCFFGKKGLGVKFVYGIGFEKNLIDI